MHIWPSEMNISTNESEEYSVPDVEFAGGWWHDAGTTAEAEAPATPLE